LVWMLYEYLTLPAAVMEELFESVLPRGELWNV